MANTILHRDETGKTQVDNTVVTVPRDRSALSVVGFNPIQDGDDFREDGWVYSPDGQRRRKWFISILGQDRARLWEPKLNDLSTLEAKRWKWYQRALARNLPFWDKIQPKIKAAGQCGGWMEFGPEAKGWLNFTPSESGVSWRWTEEHGTVKPSHINQPMVDEWFRYERRWMLSWRRVGYFNAAFLQAIDYRFRDAILNNKDMHTLHLVINGRDYWFERPRTRGHLTFFQKLAYPEDTHVVTEVV